MEVNLSLMARLEEKVDGLQRALDLQRDEGNRRGEKIEGVEMALANQDARLSEMERHVRNDCVWGNGEITGIKENIARLSVEYKNLNGDLDKVGNEIKELASSVDKMRTQIIWIIAGSVVGGGAASGASEFLLKLFT